jgi:hypothetical protein
MTFYEYTLASEVQNSMCIRIYTCMCNEECPSYGELIKILSDLRWIALVLERILSERYYYQIACDHQRNSQDCLIWSLSLYEPFFFCDLACMNLQSYCNTKEALCIYLKGMSGIHDDQLLRKAWHDLIILPMTLPFLMLCLTFVGWAYHK